MSKCNEELPAKTPKRGSNMLIANKDSSVDRNQVLDDHDGQYQEEDDDKEEDPYKGLYFSDVAHDVVDSN